MVGVRRLLAVLIVLGGLLFAAAPAQASSTVLTPGQRALSYAEAHWTGCWYYYGGTACSPGFDCSGLVQAAVWHADHILLPRTTYGMLGSALLRRVPVATAPRGALMFYGTGHVEFKTRWWHTTWGAHDWGTRVGYATWGWGWYPTMAFVLR
jgi:hypothetical protein